MSVRMIKFLTLDPKKAKGSKTASFLRMWRAEPGEPGAHHGLA